MTYVIVCYGYARGIPCPFIGQFLEHFNPTGNVKGSWTSELGLARKFETQADAMAVWQTSIGTRRDGKPDRPLTAFNVGIKPLSDFEVAP